LQIVQELLTFEDYYLVMKYYVSCLSFVAKKIMKTKLCMFWKNVDVASKSLELLNLLHDYWIPGLWSYKVVSKPCRSSPDQNWAIFPVVCEWYSDTYGTCYVVLICWLFSRCMRHVRKYCRYLFHSLRWVWAKWGRSRMLQV